MLNRILTLLFILLAASPLAAQTDTKETAPDPLSAPLPEGIQNAIRFTIEGYTYATGEQAEAFRHPLFQQVAAEGTLHRFDVIVRDAQTDSQIRNLWHFRAVFLFHDMPKFNAWYASNRAKDLIDQFNNLGARNLQMKFENIQNPAEILAPRVRR